MSWAYVPTCVSDRSSFLYHLYSHGFTLQALPSGMKTEQFSMVYHVSILIWSFSNAIFSGLLHNQCQYESHRSNCFLLPFCARSNITIVFASVQQLTLSMLSYGGTKTNSVQCQLLRLLPLWKTYFYLPFPISLSKPLFLFFYGFQLFISLSLINWFTTSLLTSSRDSLTYNLRKNLVLQALFDDVLYCCSCDYPSLNSTTPIYHVITIPWYLFTFLIHFGLFFFIFFSVLIITTFGAFVTKFVICEVSCKPYQRYMFQLVSYTYFWIRPTGRRIIIRETPFCSMLFRFLLILHLNSTSISAILLEWVEHILDTKSKASSPERCLLPYILRTNQGVWARAIWKGQKQRLSFY